MHNPEKPVDLPFCGKCRLQHDPSVACVPIALTWWQSGPWKPPSKRELQSWSVEAEASPLVRYFNPACKHDRCSFTIANCNACVAYTKELKAKRAGAKTAVDVAPKK